MKRVKVRSGYKRGVNNIAQACRDGIWKTGKNKSFYHYLSKKRINKHKMWTYC